MKNKSKLLRKNNDTFSNEIAEQQSNSLGVNWSQELYPVNNLDNLEDVENGFCPQRSCRNPNGSKVVLMDMGDYLECGQCYRRYNK